MKFSVKLALFFSCLFLTVSAVVIISLSMFSHAILKDEIGDNMEEQSLQAMDKIDRMLSNHLTHLLRLRDVVQENLLDAENEIDREGIAKRFGNFMRRNPDFLSISLYGMDRVRLIDTLGEAIGKQHGLNEYWPEIISGKEIVFDMYHSESVKRSVFHFAFLVKDKSGRPVAVFVVRIPPEDIDDIVIQAGGSHPDEKAMVLSGQMKVDLVRKDGVLVYSNYNRGGVLKDVAPEWERVREEMKKGNLWDSYENDSPTSGGELVVFAHEKGYRNFDGNGWTLIVRVPSSFVFAPAASLTNKILIILFINGVICLAGVFIFSRTVSRPIEKLDLAMAQIGKGNLDTVVDVVSNDEIGRLAGNFNKMAGQLAHSTNVIKEHSASLEKEITERKLTEEALKRAEEKFRAYTENISDSISVVGADHKLTYVSPSIMGIIGYTPEETMEKDVPNLIHPDDLPIIAGAMARVLEHPGSTDTVQYRMIHKNGSYVHVETTGVSMMDNPAVQGVVLAIRNITERKKTEEDIRERMHHAEFVAEIGMALTESGSMRDALGKCCESMVNNLDAAFARVWTFNETENMLELQASAGMYTHIDGGHSRVPVGKFKIGLIAQERKPHLTNQVVGDPRVGEQEWAKREGMAAFAGYPLVIDDKLIGVMAMFARKPLSEMTLRMLRTAAYEMALGVKHRADVEVIKESRAMAESATKLKDKLVTLVAHDMKSPLTGVHGLLKHVLDRDEGELPDYAKQSISRSVKSCEKMIKLSEDLLDLGMLRVGKIKPACEVIDAWPCVIEAIAAIEQHFSQKGISLVNMVPERSFQFADSKLLARVIQNLLANAIKFSKPGGAVTVFIPEGNPTTIAVEDTGIGIRADKIANIFEYTGSVSTTGTGGERGTGMGLPLSYEIVKAMGGNLRVESSEGKGSVFFVDLQGSGTAPGVAGA